MSTIDVTPASPSSLDQKLMRRLAHCMFRAEFTNTAAKTTPEEKKAAWSSQRVDYVKRARKLYRALENEGVEVTLKGDQQAK